MVSKYSKQVENNEDTLDLKDGVFVHAFITEGVKKDEAEAA